MIVIEKGGLRVRPILESSPLLSALSVDQMSDLESACSVCSCSRGEPIWGSGESVDFFGLVGAGFVKMVKSSAAGIEMTMEIMGPGQIFGLLGVMAGAGCPLMAHGLTNTSYVRIPKAKFLEVYEANDRLKDLLLRRTAIRMHQKLDFMAKLSSGRAEHRLAAILLILAESYGVREGKGIKLDVPLTRQALAEMAGLTTETTIRVISRWTQESILNTDQHFVTICDEPSLETKLT